MNKNKVLIIIAAVLLIVFMAMGISAQPPQRNDGKTKEWIEKRAEQHHEGMKARFGQRSFRGHFGDRPTSGTVRQGFKLSEKDKCPTCEGPNKEARARMMKMREAMMKKMREAMMKKYRGSEHRRTQGRSHGRSFRDNDRKGPQKASHGRPQGKSFHADKKEPQKSSHGKS